MNWNKLKMNSKIMSKVLQPWILKYVVNIDCRKSYSLSYILVYKTRCRTEYSSSWEYIVEWRIETNAWKCESLSRRTETFEKRLWSSIELYSWRHSRIVVKISYRKTKKFLYCVFNPCCSVTLWLFFPSHLTTCFNFVCISNTFRSDKIVFVPVYFIFSHLLCHIDI